MTLLSPPATRHQPPAGSAIIDKYLAFQVLNDHPTDQMTQGDWLLWGELASAIAPFLMADLVELKHSSETYAIKTAARIKYLETRLSNLVSAAAPAQPQVDTISRPAVLVTAGAGDARQADTIDPEVPTSHQPRATSLFSPPRSPYA